MTNGKTQPSMIPEAHGISGPWSGPIGSAIDSRVAPGNIRYVKRVIRLVDISATAPGTEISLGFTGEIALFSDFPVDVIVGDSPGVYSAITQLVLVGQISKLKIRKRFSAAVGRIVIFMGDPYLGTSWRREDPQQMGRVKTSGTTPITWTGGAANITSTTLAVPIVALGVPLEAYWIFAVHFVRTAGIIEYVEILEQETGGSNQVAVIDNESLSDRLTVRFENPIRVACSHAYKLVGSTEAADTDVAWWIETVLV